MAKLAITKPKKMAPKVIVNSGAPADGGSVVVLETTDTLVVVTEGAPVGTGVSAEAVIADTVDVGVGATVGVSGAGVALLHKSPSQHVTLQEVIVGWEAN